MKSLNQIIAELETFANVHYQIHTFGHGDVWEIAPNSSSIVYPILWLVPQGATTGLREVTTNFTVLCMDLVRSGEENETEVLSDTLQILLDVISYYRQQHDQNYIIEFGSNIQPFTERDPDMLAGHSITISIRQPFNYSECAIPFSGAPVPIVPTCAAATIQNASSNPTYQASIASGANLVLPQLKILDSDGVTEILADYIPETDGFAATCSTSCPDVTEQVNGTTVGTTASGGTNNQLIKDTAGNTVGTAANPSIIGDATVENSDSTVTVTVKAEGSETFPDTQISANGDFVVNQPSGVPKDLVIRYVSQGVVPTTIVSGDVVVPDVLSVPSLSIATSNASPNFGDSITITATPSNFTPTGYKLASPDKDGDYTVSPSQISPIFNITAANIGTGEYYIIATDGTSEVYNSVSITTTVDLPIINGKGVFGYYKMIASYTGYWCNVRRFSDNATLDIAYVNGVGDIDAIYAFAGSTGWAITKVYNQVVNGDMVQSTANLQPSLNDDGSIANIGGANDFRLAVTYTSGFALGETSTDHIIFTSHVAATSNSRIVSSTPNNTRTIGIGYSGTNIPFMFYNNTSLTYGSAIDIQKRTHYVSEFKNSSLKSWVNGLQIINDTSSTFTINAITGMEYFAQGGGFPIIKGADLYSHVSYANERIEAVEDILNLLYGT